MPVICDSSEAKMVCESTLSGAIREALSSSTSHGGSHGNGINGNDELNIQDRLIACAKRLLINKLEYEEAPSSSTTLYENLKSKYTVLKPGIAAATTTTTTGGQKLLQNGMHLPERNVLANGHSGTQQGNNKQTPTLPKPKRILFPISNVHIGWKSLGRRWNVGSGMINMGNTCYLNSTLQAIFHVPSVASWLISDVDHRQRCCENDSGCIICAMAKTLMQSQNGNNPFRPQNVYFKLKHICKHLTPGRQEDAHEFLRYLIEAMEKAYLARFKGWKEFDQYTKETTPLNQILGGYLKSAVKCLSCQHVSVTFQHFQDLLLDVRKSNSIDEGVENYFARERLEDTGYKCEACKKRVTATKQFSIEKAPIALCVQLKRFSVLGGKINKHISMRHTLNLNAYASNKAETRNLSYRLVSLVTHIGASQHCGHYTAIGCTESGQYYHFDDSMVSHVQPQRVLETQAYLLFYELIPSTANGGVKIVTPVEKEYNMFAQDKKVVSPVASTSTNGTTNGVGSTEKKFIGPMLPQKNGSSAINGTNKPLVNKILLGSKVISGEKALSNGIVSPKKIQILSPAKNNKPSLITTSPSSVNNKQEEAQKGPTLPSMPTLTCSSVQKSPSPSPAKQKVLQTNGFLDDKPKSLVPYDLDESDSETGPNVANGVKKDAADDDDDDAENVLETKTGLWHISDSSPEAPSRQGSTDNFASRPASAPSTPTGNNSPNYEQNNHSDKSNCKRSNSFNGNSTSNVVADALPHLLQMSHRGYGTSNVQTWNGERTKMDKELAEEKREDRKRQFQDDRETEMDRGRTKKVKKSHEEFRSRSEHNGNAFQQQQNRENAHQNRAKWLANNRSKAFHHHGGNKNSDSSSSNGYQRHFSSNNSSSYNGNNNRNNFKNGHRNNNRRNFSHYNGGNNRYHNQRENNYRRH
ncbi:ubiquitin carboxyl-terminal hydrolase 36 [Culicoides brevitarsis]|uniref:ubiquitin carboxyl-terminal hydrolase 36 n=1 Tax=Culicoides brevitarsis TaxID=469753 RepID=UPI00307B51F9